MAFAFHSGASTIKQEPNRMNASPVSAKRARSAGLFLAPAILGSRTSSLPSTRNPATRPSNASPAFERGDIHSALNRSQLAPAFSAGFCGGAAGAGCAAARTAASRSCSQAVVAGRAGLRPWPRTFSIRAKASADLPALVRPAAWAHKGPRSSAGVGVGTGLGVVCAPTVAPTAAAGTVPATVRQIMTKASRTPGTGAPALKDRCRSDLDIEFVSGAETDAFESSLPMYVASLRGLHTHCAARTVILRSAGPKGKTAIQCRASTEWFRQAQPAGPSSRRAQPPDAKGPADQARVPGPAGPSVAERYFAAMVQSPSELTWTKPGVSFTVPL